MVLMEFIKNTSSFKPIHGVNQVFKLALDEYYITDEGFMFGDEDNNNIYGTINNDVYKLFNIPKGKVIKIFSKILYKVYDKEKKQLISLCVDETGLYFKTHELGDIYIGLFMDKPIHIINFKTYETTFRSKLFKDEVDKLCDKKVVTNEMFNGEKMILTHKLFPGIDKSTYNNLYISDMGNTFIADFMFTFHNSKTNTEVTLCYRYRFLKY